MLSGIWFALCICTGTVHGSVTSHDVFVAKLQRTPNKHIGSDSIDFMIEDYNYLVRNSRSLHKVKDPYILTFYLILCEQSLMGDDEIHPRLDVPCEAISAGKVRDRAWQKILHTIRDVNPAGIIPVLAPWQITLNNFVSAIESGHAAIKNPNKRWGDQRPSIIQMWNELITNNKLVSPTSHGYHEQAMCVLHAAGVSKTISTNEELCEYLFRGIVAGTLSDKVLGPIRHVLFTNLCKSDLLSQAKHRYQNVDTSAMTIPAPTSSTPRSLSETIMNAFNEIMMERPVESNLAIVAESVEKVKASPPAEPLDPRYAIYHLKLCFWLASMPNVCADMPTRLDRTESWMFELGLYIAQIRMGEIHALVPTTGRHAILTRNLIIANWNSLIQTNLAPTNADDRDVQLAFQLIYAHDTFSISKTKIASDEKLCRILREASASHPGTIIPDQSAFIDSLCSGVATV